MRDIPTLACSAGWLKFKNPYTLIKAGKHHLALLLAANFVEPYTIQSETPHATAVFAGVFRRVRDVYNVEILYVCARSWGKTVTYPLSTNMLYRRVPAISRM